MRIFVAGATGAIGRRLVPQLVARGHLVTATTRDPGKADLLRRLGAEPAIVDGLDPVGIGEAVARATPDAIVHQMTALAGTPDLRRFDRWFHATNELRTAGTEHLLAAARAEGVERFVAQSFSGWNNARTGGPVKTEDDPLDAEPAAEQRESMAAIVRLEAATVVAVRWMTQGRGASNGKARTELGWAPRWASWREGFSHGLADPAEASGPATVGGARVR